MPHKVSDGHPLRPFADAPYPRPIREAVDGVWRWHEHLWEASLSASREDLLRAHDVLLEGSRPDLISPDLYEAMQHIRRVGKVPMEPFASQIRGAVRLVPPTRFADWPDLSNFLSTLIFNHASILAQLADVYRHWQRPMVHELAQGLFLTGRLLHLPGDVAQDRIFFPQSDLASFGLKEEDLQGPTPSEQLRKYLWQWSIRARLSLSMAVPLVHDLQRRYRWNFKKWWLGTLEVLREIERRDFDLWSAPVVLSPRQRFQVYLQALAGRTTFRTR